MCPASPTATDDCATWRRQVIIMPVTNTEFNYHYIRVAGTTLITMPWPDNTDAHDILTQNHGPLAFIRADHHMQEIQWHVFTNEELDDGLDRWASRIQRAYRARLARRREAAMLAFAMALHERLGRQSTAAALAPDVLPVIACRV